MKRVQINSNCLIPSGVEGQMATAYVDSVLDLDDNTAGQIVVAQRASYVRRDKDGKYLAEPVDTTAAHEKAAAKAAASAADPTTAFAAAVAAAVAQALRAPAAAAK